MDYEDMPSMDAIAKTMERIRTERDVLRVERDSLRRNFDFFKIETRFTTENLQNQLHAARATSTSSHHCINPSKVVHASKAALVSILVAQHLQSQQEADASRIATLSQATRQAEQRAEIAERKIREKEVEMRRTRAEDVEMRDALTVTEVKLANSERKMADLTSLVARLEEDLQQERTDHEEIGGTLSRAEEQMSDLSRSLDESESQRNTLALQVAHLEQDLQNVKNELDESESRYHTLQQQQLATMSSNEATKALRRQIEELEARIMRRTEQIGVHQHDIKKLDMNLRLQEERVAELTADNEVLETEKTAMVDDCRTTREERDTALRRCEELEENIEVLEAETSAVEERRSRELQAMVSIVADAAAKRKTIFRSLCLFTSRYDSREQELAAQLHAAEEAGALTRSHADHLSSEQSNALATLRDTALRLEASQYSERTAYAQSRQATVALATVYTGLKRTNASLDLARGARRSLHAQLDRTREDLEQKLGELSSLRAEYEALRSRSGQESIEAHKRHAEQTAELEQHCEALRKANEDLEARYLQTRVELSRVQEQIHLHVSDSADRIQEEDALRSELDKAQRNYQDEANHLRTELARATEELEAAYLKQAELESAHRQTLDDISAAREELQQSMTEALEKLEASRMTEAELTGTQSRHLAEIDTLQERLEAATKSLERITSARDELLSEHGSAFKELDEKRAEAEALLRAKEDLELQAEDAKTCFAAELKILEERLDIASKEKVEVQTSLTEVETRLDETAKTRDELEDQLSKANTDIERLRGELKAESERRKREAEQHDADLRAEKELNDRAQLGQGELQDEVVSLRRQLRDAEASIQAAHEERSELQGQMTELEAEIQRALSLQRHRESQIQDGHKQASALNEQVEHIRADYIRAEKEWKAAEINLALQAAQHEKVVSILRNEIETLQEASRLEETVAELRERNEEMEELLRAKCLEIEENDDRFIELIKEKKKLTSKVDSLTRKVKTLQDKVAAGNQDLTPKANPLASSSSNPPIASTSRSSPPAPPPTQPLPAPPTFHPAASTSHVRASTTPAAISRPKTPEARVPPTVFKARTPESRRRSSQKPAPDQAPKASFQPFQDAVQPLQEAFVGSTSTTVGKKRRVPDDFEDCEGVPPQVFTADSVPSHENPNTPRVRRALQASRAGFTPVRSTRTLGQQPSSPPRATGGAALIADVTNSPRSKAAQKSKRGWLGTLRGGSSQAARTASSSRPALDRTQNAR